MSPQQAWIAHSTQGRTRLQMPALRGDRGGLESVARRLGQVDALDGVTANPATGSLVLLHRVGWGELAGRIERSGVLRIEGPLPDMAPLSRWVAGVADRLDAEVRSNTSGSLDLGSLGFVLMMGASALQLARGQVLGPASNLFFLGLTSLARSFRDAATKPPPEA